MTSALYLVFPPLAISSSSILWAKQAVEIHSLSADMHVAPREAITGVYIVMHAVANTY